MPVLYQKDCHLSDGSSFCVKNYVIKVHFGGKMKKRVNNLLWTMLALLTAMSFSMTGELLQKGTFQQMLAKEVDGRNAEFLVVFIAALVLYGKLWDSFKQTSKLITHLLSAVLAGCMIIGLSFSKLGSWAFIFYSKKQLLIAFMTFCGFWILLDFGIAFLYAYFSRRKAAGNKIELPEIVKRHPLLFAFLLIEVCWFPYLFLCWPGSVPWDGWRQIWMYNGYCEFYNLHPWQTTLLIGWLMDLGCHISDNFGVFTVVSVFSTIEAFCYGVVCSKIWKWKKSTAAYVWSGLFFGVVPIFGAFAEAILKDSLFGAFFACYVVILLDVCISGKNNTKLKQWLCLSIAALCVCIVRKNGVYIVVPSLLFAMIFVERKKWKFIGIMAVVFIVLQGAVNPKIAEAIGVAPGSVRAVLAIPLQQTARYVRTYPEDVTEEEKAAINGVMDFDQIGILYNPENYDPVKLNFADKMDALPAEERNKRLSEYFKAWKSMFLRHPGVYVEATLHGTYGYIYPFHECGVQKLYPFGIKKDLREHFKVRFVVPKKYRNIITGWAYLWLKFPVTSQLMNPGMYTWILLIAAGYLFYRRKWLGIFALAAPALNVAVCVASPINGLVRYSFPLLACLPAIICWCLTYSED